MSVSMQDAAKVLWGNKQPTQNVCWGTVKAVNDNGTVEVALNEQITTTCSKTCACRTDDRALVLLMNTGAVVIGVRL